MRVSRGELLQGRFWAKVQVGPECWTWKASRLPTGYGHIKVDGRMRGAHRVSWELANGPIPAGIDVLHKCDNPPCVRPDHLFLGTQADNAKDMVAKGRGLTPEQQAAIDRPRGDEHWSRKRPELVRRGAAHHKAKLTEDQVREIRRRYAAGERLVPLAAEFGVAFTSVSMIVRRETWRHI